MNKLTKKYAVYNLIVGAIFTLFFGAIVIYGGISLSDSHSNFQLTNGIFTLIIGLLGTIDGINTVLKGFKIINLGRSDVSMGEKGNNS
jgi:hypothetical protein